MKLVTLGLCCVLALLSGCSDDSTGNDNNNIQRCGNGEIDGIEQCDGANLNAETCEALGFTAGTLTCTASCVLDTTQCGPPVTCGNGEVNAPEQCDGAELGGATCQSLDFAGGPLYCDQDCRYDTSQCIPATVCGDGNVDSPEEDCDGDNLNNATCVSLGYEGGTLTCTGGCEFDTSNCNIPEHCGNNQVDTAEGEQCDGTLLNGATCESEGYDGGMLGCTSACQFDFTGCHECGDSVRNGTEECDGLDLGGATCQSQAGEQHGTLACTASCTFDTSACHTCGNGALEGPEVCDGAELDSETCQSQASLADGDLACQASCLAFDASGCHDCGNGVAEGPEQCDTADFGGATCASETGNADGDLACLGDCTLDTSGCYTCGNGQIEGPEVCDGANVGGETCQSQAGASDGTLACEASCLAYDTSDCHECGNGVLEGSEACDGDEYTDSCISLGYGTGPIACTASCQLDTSQCVTCTWRWDPISTAGGLAPSATAEHAAVWMPQYGKMFVFGGVPTHNIYASMYDPIADDWEITINIGSPPSFPSTVWTGSDVLIWSDSGASYDPFTNSGSGFTPSPNEPFVDRHHSAVWTGTEMIIWGGGSGTNYGARYNPTTDTWTPTSQGTNCPVQRYEHAAIWTGTEMIIWGGGPGGTNTGGRYYPASDTWVPTSTGGNCPQARTGIQQAVVWTGTHMIVWGGTFGSILSSGGLYDPASDTWQPTSTGANTPQGRTRHTAVWTGAEVIIWGGEYFPGGTPTQLNDGAHYDPVTDTWRPVEMIGVPQPREEHTAVWTGNEMIVWGGEYYQGGSDHQLADGARYWCDPN